MRRALLATVIVILTGVVLAADAWVVTAELLTGSAKVTVMRSEMKGRKYVVMQTDTRDYHSASAALSAKEARRLAAELVAAADQLER